MTLVLQCCSQLIIRLTFHPHAKCRMEYTKSQENTIVECKALCICAGLHSVHIHFQNVYSLHMLTNHRCCWKIFQIKLFYYLILIQFYRFLAFILKTKLESKEILLLTWHYISVYCTVYALYLTNLNVLVLATIKAQ